MAFVRGCFVVMLCLFCIIIGLSASHSSDMRKIYRENSVQRKSKGDELHSSGKSFFTKEKVKGITFLVAVNDTWGSCITTVKTPMLKPDVPRNMSKVIKVGECDSGPLTFTVSPKTNDGNLTIFLTFYSSVILDASPPVCSISFSGHFLPPTSMICHDGSLPSVLPGCSTAESREGYHMTYYWFYIYDWHLA